MSRTFYKNIEAELNNFGFQIIDSNFEKPLGGIFVLMKSKFKPFAINFLMVLMYIA